MRAVVALFTMLLSLAACAQETGGKFKAGEYYEVLPQAVAQDDDSKIEVTELFWYGCGHCYHFEVPLKKWQKTMPEDVALKKIPAIWQPVMEVHSRIFYVAEAMGVLDQVHAPIFNAIAQQRKMFATRDGRDWKADDAAIAAIFNDNGADGAKAVKLLNSFAINSKIKQGQAKQRAYNLSGTPEMVVAGKYRVSTSLPGFKGKSNGQQVMLDVVDFLIEKERAEKG
ncbi:thiol:disulfide interchange protein DsbA/DsbL [Microbulbifer sp. CAU 1566]|uniref:thiol:disulfide interchange protein DsbA/DsbL n=1 Tax=unclassified Microbulbifer TaxID=2619833 RepID=UPI001356D597|nr:MULTISPECIES: thiol:disulfide interchange protein DsbA/DsbL [unclassified Microbulbifer]MCK7598132.1 thiol:disulfide interchange protein DsbA/DsbL [Microbulbifer sp. CAU 1566]